jgi:hypothetical protein
MSARINRYFAVITAFAAAGSLALAGCSPSEREAAQKTGESMGDAARDAATTTGRVALAPAVNPVLDLLRKAESQVNQGNVAAAITTMGGFSALWATAAPVIQPLAGDKWPMIDNAAKLALNTFEKGATPDAAAAGSAITGLMGPLNSLVGN